MNTITHLALLEVKFKKKNSKTRNTNNYYTDLPYLVDVIFPSYIDLRVNKTCALF